MRKPFITVYLDPALLRTLEAYAKTRGAPKSTVAEAAIAAFLSPDDKSGDAAALNQRLDRISRRADRLERDLGILVEMLALFIRFWLTATPPVPDSAQEAARTKGRERYKGFVDALGRRLAAGRSFTRDVSDEVDTDPSA